LAGGASSRMRKPKAALRLGDKTFLERAAVSLSKIAKNRVFVVGAKIENSFDLPILPDIFQSNSRAALIGLHTAFTKAGNDLAAILACDLPFADGVLFERLIDFTDDDFAAVVPLQPDGKPQPLCALYRAADCLLFAEKMLSETNWSLQKFLREIGSTRFVRFAEINDLPNAKNFFFNVNTPADFEMAKQIFAAN